MELKSHYMRIGQEFHCYFCHLTIVGDDTGHVLSHIETGEEKSTPCTSDCGRLWRKPLCSNGAPGCRCQDKPPARNLFSEAKIESPKLIQVSICTTKNGNDRVVGLDSEGMVWKLDQNTLQWNKIGHPDFNK